MKIGPINNNDQLDKADPETVRFHSTFKAIARMLAKYLPFSQVDEETYSAHLTGNASVFYKIIKEWETHDKKERRRDLLSKPLKIGVFTYFFDSDYREVFNFMANRMIQEYIQGNLFFPPAHLDPSTWMNNENARHIQGVKVPDELVLQISPGMFILKNLIPPQIYWVEIKGQYYSTNTNRPVWVGDGWGYQILNAWGGEEEFKEKACLGDR